VDEGAQIVARCRELATISEEPGRLARPCATPAMARANALVGTWMREAGMAVRADAAGNLVGRLPGTDPDAGTLLLGSHLDTVRGAGAFDGPLGVLCAVALAGRLSATGAAPPFAIDVYGFADEEGLRFGTTYLGSRAVAGTFDGALLDVRDEDGVSVREALLAFGADPEAAAAGAAARRGERLLGYVEVHMEQGPVLEERDAPVGVVTAIAGATRVAVTFTGRAGHAGTVPMALRRDAAPAVAELVLAAEELARATDGLVATVGRLGLAPGAPNVIAGAGTAFLDVRHADDGARRGALAALQQRARAIGAARGLEVAWEVVLDAPAVAMDESLTARLSAGARDAGLPELRLPSGAGHDAVALADLCPVAMLFVRCAGGVSHHPAEDVAAADAGAALDVLEAFVRGLASA
jgi:allantoate deiminase